VAMELERVHAMRPGEHRDDRAHAGDVHGGAVEDDQRLALAGHLVIRALNMVDSSGAVAVGLYCRRRTSVGRIDTAARPWDPTRPCPRPEHRATFIASPSYGARAQIMGLNEIIV
jgi:hypothetical protein